MLVEPRSRRNPVQRLKTDLLDLAQGTAEILSHSEKSWASITFSGSRHRLTLQFTGEEAVAAAENFIAFLPEHEFVIPRHLVAHADVTEVTHTLSPAQITLNCEILLLEDG